MADSSLINLIGCSLDGWDKIIKQVTTRSLLKIKKKII